MARTLQVASEIIEGEFQAASKVVQAEAMKAVDGDADKQRLADAQQRIPLFRVTQMLAQMSLENDLKACIVSQGKKWPTKHDLTELANEAGLTLTDQESNTLDVLNRMNQLGRYRVGGNAKLGFTHGAVSVHDLEALLRPIRQKVEERIVR